MIPSVWRIAVFMRFSSDAVLEDFDEVCKVLTYIPPTGQRVIEYEVIVPKAWERSGGKPVIITVNATLLAESSVRAEQDFMALFEPSNFPVIAHTQPQLVHGYL